MTEIFIDGLRSIAVANGVVRVELVRLRRAEGKSNLEPELVGTLMLPTGALKAVAGQLAGTLEKLEQAGQAERAKGGRVSAKVGGSAAGGEDLDSALRNL